MPETKLNRWFIGGCNHPFPVLGDPKAGEFRLDDLQACKWTSNTVPGPPRRALASAPDHLQAKEICRRCPFGDTQPYLETAPDVAADAATAAPGAPNEPPEAPARPLPPEPPEPAWDGWGYPPEAAPAEPDKAAEVEQRRADIHEPEPELSAVAREAERAAKLLVWVQTRFPAVRSLGAWTAYKDKTARYTCDADGNNIGYAWMDEKIGTPGFFSTPAPTKPEEKKSPAPAPQPKGAMRGGVVPFDPRGKQIYDRVRPSTPPIPAPGTQAKPGLESLMPGIVGGPTIFGTTTVRCARTCLRMFCYQYVLGWRAPRGAPEETPPNRPTRLSPLDVGIGVHACAEVYYKSHFDRLEATKVVEAIKPHYPALAAEITRLFGYYLRGFGDEDSRTWDVRAVELESRYYYPKRKCRGARRSLCVSARHDTVPRIVTPGAPRLEPGAPSAGSPGALWVHDLKTIAQLTDNAKRAWRHDLQGLQNLLCFNEGFVMLPPDPERGLPRRVSPTPAVEHFGPAEGMIITHIGKAKQHVPAEHLHRGKYVMSADLVSSYRDETGDFLYEEVFDRLLAKDELRSALDTWPRSFLACRDPITNRTCKYLALCESNGRTDPARVGFERRPALSADDLLAPKKKSTRKKKVKGPAQAEDK